MAKIPMPPDIDEIDAYKARRSSRFTKGYDFALEELKNSFDARTDLLQKVEEARDFDAFDDFDRGVQQAIHDWDNKKVQS